jgi:hypothetical protein
LVHERQKSLLSGIHPHKTLVDNKITGWLGVSEPKETDYQREVLFPAFTEDAAEMSVFDLLPMDLNLPFIRDLPVGYAIIGKITGETMVEAWNVFAGAGENSHQWIDTPFYHRCAEVMADGGKQMTLCWGQVGT